MDNIKRNNSDSDLSDDWNVIDAKDAPPVVSESESIEVLEEEEDEDEEDYNDNNGGEEKKKEYESVKEVKSGIGSDMEGLIRCDKELRVPRNNKVNVVGRSGQQATYFCVFPEEFHNVFSDTNYSNVNTSEIMCSVSLIILCTVASSFMVLNTDNLMPSFLDVLVWQSLPDNQKDMSMNNRGLINERLKIYKDRNEFLESRLSYLNLAVKAYEENMISGAALIEFVTDLESSTEQLERKKVVENELGIEFPSSMLQTINKDAQDMALKESRDNGFKNDNFDSIVSQYGSATISNKNSDGTDGLFFSDNKKKPAKLVSKLLMLFSSSSEPGISLSRASLILVNIKNQLEELKKLQCEFVNKYTDDMKLKKMSSRIQSIEDNFEVEIYNFIYKLSNKFYSSIERFNENLKNYICKNIKKYGNNFDTDGKYKEFCNKSKHDNVKRENKNKVVKIDHVLHKNNYKFSEIRENSKKIENRKSIDDVYNLENNINVKDVGDEKSSKNKKPDYGGKKSNLKPNNGYGYNYSNLYKTDGDTIGKSKVNSLENVNGKYDQIINDDYNKNHKNNNNYKHEEMAKNLTSGEKQTNILDSNGYKNDKKLNDIEKTRIKTDDNPDVVTKIKNKNEKNDSHEIKHFKEVEKINLKGRIKYYKTKDKSKSKRKQCVKSDIDLDQNSDCVKNNIDKLNSCEQERCDKSYTKSDSKINKIYKLSNENKKVNKRNISKTTEKYFGKKKEMNDGISNKKNKNGNKENVLKRNSPASNQEKNKYQKKITVHDINKFKEDILNSVNNYIDDLLINFKSSSYDEDKNNSSTFFGDSKIFPGYWFLSLGQKRSEIRAEKKKSDWLFDRAVGRHNLRDENDIAYGFYEQTLWYFRRAWERNRYRY